jgi:shikimate kinase
MKIFLIGFMGSGKTTLGRKLAKRLDYQSIDLDKSIEFTQQMFIPTIFEQFGEEQFRSWERDELLTIIGNENVVISTGGGTPCFSDNMNLMNSSGITVYLKMSPAALKSRLRKAKLPRPLLENKSSDEVSSIISQLLAEREIFYNQAQISIDGLNPDLNNLIDILAIE